MDAFAPNKSSTLHFPSRLFAQPFRRFLILLVALQLLVQAVEGVTIAWNENSEPDIAGYRVYYGTKSWSYTVILDVGNITTATISNLSSENTYYFVVTAYNTAGLESSPSTAIYFSPSNKAENLAGTNIGSATGGSDMLADDSRELIGSGFGVMGIADSGYFERAPQTGNFQALVRIQSLTSSGAAPEVGLMLRESTAADARFALVAATPDGYSFASRTLAGGSSSKTVVTAPTQFPAVWVLIERDADSITFATSRDGLNFNSVGSSIIASLADEVDLGLFVSSGTAGVDARAVVTYYSVIEATFPPSGLTAQYFDDMDLMNLRLIRVDPTVDFSWQRLSPDPALPSDYFSVRWTGKVEPRYSETYSFYTNSDDGVRLWVNGKLLIEDWSNHPQKENTGTISLTAGQKYEIVMEYYEYEYGAVAQLLWSSPRQPKEIIPKGALTPDHP